MNEQLKRDIELLNFFTMKANQMATSLKAMNEVSDMADNMVNVAARLRTMLETGNEYGAFKS